MYSAMSCSWQTASIAKLSTSGLAIEGGTGVIKPTHILDNLGLMTLTGMIFGRLNPDTSAYPSIIP